jgi:hypothetical protein
VDNDKIDIKKNSELADRIYKLSAFDIAVPDFGNDFDVYSAYLKRIDGWRQRAIDWAVTKLPTSIVMHDGEVFFTRSSLRNALAHGRGKLKLLSIPYIPKMLQNGVLFHTETEREKEFVYLNYAHPFMFEGESHHAIIVVREDQNGKRFYDNEFITKAKSADGLDYSQGLPATRQKTCAHPSAGSILRSILYNK